jgi:hypothetical protein
VTSWSVLALLAVTLACSSACDQAIAKSEVLQIQETAADFDYDNFLEDGKLKHDVLKLVSSHIARNRRAHGHLVYTGNPSGRKRQFSVVQIFDVVSCKGKVYTVQADVDEIGGKERLLLFFDVTNRGNNLELRAVRLGPRHLRQAKAALLFVVREYKARPRNPRLDNQSQQGV